MKKRIIVYSALASLILIVVGYRFFLGPGVNLVNYVRIQPGMDLREVEELLGGPQNGPLWMQGLPLRVPNQGWIEYWGNHDDVGGITIIYDKSGKVVHKEWDLSRSLYRVFVERLRGEKIRE